ncbi:hypothetical protein PFLUV_G00124710 [Perca fluviatilis]|uniref:Uncharacterized protein n=1 Tax=Perca fluviatilis TaxID=8168 RepID=A0A6A5F703_PERFL|nr:hypothetical protein PFLUV_G00124710 [Perca fluviatilis]
MYDENGGVLEQDLSSVSTTESLLQLLLRSSRGQLCDQQQHTARCSVIQHVCALKDAANGVKVQDKSQWMDSQLTWRQI